MNYILKTLTIVFLVLLNSCGDKNEKKIILDKTNLELQMIKAYRQGVEALEEGDALYAATNFKMAQNLFPQSEWAAKSNIMAAYAYYSQDYYGDAISELEQFIKTYPKNKYEAYAYYLIALCHYERIVDEKKDLKPLIKSKEYFKSLVEMYPSTDFAIDAKFKILLIENIMASKEIYIAKYYLKKEKWIPAINRFKNVLTHYSETQYVEEAIHRLVEVYYKIGLEQESRKYAKLLGYNYLSSEWYEESYKVFNKEYENSKDKIIKNKQNRVIKNFKKLFD